MLRRKFHIPISIDFAVLILRVFPSLFMLTYGWEKLAKLISGDWTFADPLGLGEGISLFLAVLAEFFGSLLIIFGLMTRPALLLLIFTMTVASFIVHASDPISVKEHAITFLIIYTAIFITGPGRFSIDNRIFSR
jgi:putative oxidoreductase